MLGMFALTIVLTGMVLGVSHGMRSYFSGVHPRVWPALLGICAVVSLAIVPSLAAWGRARGLTAEGHGVVAGMFVAAITFAVAARRIWRTAAARRFVFGTGLRGEAGLVALGLIVAALITQGALGLVLGIVGGAGFVVLITLDIVREQSAFERARLRVENPQPWPKPKTDEQEGWNPYADERVTGMWGDCRVWFAMSSRGALVKVQIEHWPAGLAAERADGEPAAVTGDDDFDRRVRLDGAEERWRPLMTSALRTALTPLIEATGAVISRDRTITVELYDGRRLERTLDELTRFARLVTPLPEDPRDRVFELAQAEPIAAVRRHHYCWLVEHQWDTPRVFRAAAADDDPEIAAWGRDQLPPDTGAFR